MALSDTGRRASIGIEHIIESLHSKGVQLWVEGGTLRYRARKGTVTSSDIANLRSAEAEILSLLSSFDNAKRFEPELLPRPSKVCGPLAFSQLTQWEIHETIQHRPVRQIISATRIQGALEVGALKEAISDVGRRHEALRTRIVVSDGSPVQEVVECHKCTLELINSRAIPSQTRRMEIRRHIESAVLDAVDYAADPLFRAALIKLAADDNILILALDHMISDGASLSVVQGEMLDAYAQLVKGHLIKLPAVGMQSIDYAVWQRASLVDCLERQVAERGDLCRTRFPEDPNATGEHGWGAVRFSLGADSRIALQQLARRRGTSITMVALTAYVALIMRWCDVRTSVVQVMSDGRTSPLLENTIASLAFPLYVHIGLEGRETFLDMLEIVKHEYCKAFQRPDFYYSYLHRPVAGFTRNTRFNWLPRRGGFDGARPVERGVPLAFSRVEFAHPLLNIFNFDSEPSVVFEEMTDDITGEVSFPRSRFSYNTISSFVEELKAVVRLFLESSCPRVSDIPKRVVEGRPAR